jgi:hypothetical protein
MCLCRTPLFSNGVTAGNRTRDHLPEQQARGRAAFAVNITSDE